MILLLLWLFFGQVLPSDHLHWHAALPYNVVDGDTIDATIDTDFRQRRDERLRLVWYDEASAARCGGDRDCLDRAVVGIDTPEVRGATREQGLAAKAYVEYWLAEHAKANTRTLTWGGQEVNYFMARTEKGDSFGRWLTDLRDQNGVSLARELLDTGHAVVYEP